jgi:hypothetical protein
MFNTPMNYDLVFVIGLGKRQGNKDTPRSNVILSSTKPRTAYTELHMHYSS